MADNRMYLRCKWCGATFFLGKRLGGGYYLEEYAEYKGVPLLDRLNKFYDEHVYCRGRDIDYFEITYEDKPDWEADT